MSTGLSCADLLKHRTNRDLLQAQHLVRSIEMVKILEPICNYTYHLL